MGWKNMKEHYRIAHIVQVTEEGICIGSAYFHNIIVIGLDGTIKKRIHSLNNEDLSRYLREMDADPAMLRKLIQSPDTFTASVIVYTYNGADIIEKQCEMPGWPNVTHDGYIMYDNTFSTDINTVIAWAKNTADCKIIGLTSRIAELEEQINKMELQLINHKNDREKLETAYPSSPSPELTNLQ